MCFRLASTAVLESPDDAVGGVGGAAGMKREGIHATVAMMLTISTVDRTDPSNGLISCANAPPSGFARLANAVAPTRPPSVNHMSLYLVGAARTKGWARPQRTCPNTTRPKILARVPAKRIQLPSSRRQEEARMLALGP